MKEGPIGRITHRAKKEARRLGIGLAVSVGGTLLGDEALSHYSDGQYVFGGASAAFGLGVDGLLRRSDRYFSDGAATGLSWILKGITATGAGFSAASGPREMTVFLAGYTTGGLVLPIANFVKERVSEKRRKKTEKRVNEIRRQTLGSHNEDKE